MQKTADTKAVTRTIEAALAVSGRPAPAAEVAASATKGREAEGDLSVPMELARATFWTEDQATFEGSLFLHLTAESHDGPETVMDRLNTPDRFLVLSVADDSPVVFLNKAQIIRVDVPSAAGPPDAAEAAMEVEHVRVRLINGEELDGTVRVDGPVGRHRLSGLLNAQSAFLLLQGQARLHLLQKRFISRIILRES
jgi:hypothetical protein